MFSGPTYHTSLFLKIRSVQSSSALQKQQFLHLIYCSAIFSNKMQRFLAPLRKNHKLENPGIWWHLARTLIFLHMNYLSCWRLAFFFSFIRRNISLIFTVTGFRNLSEKRHNTKTCFMSVKNDLDLFRDVDLKFRATTLTSKTSFTRGLQKPKFCPRNPKDLDSELKDSNEIRRYLMNHQVLYQHIFCSQHSNPVMQYNHLASNHP